jgi:integrase
MRDVQEFVDELVRDDADPATIHATLTPLCAYYRRALSRGEVRMDPTKGIEKPAVRPKLRRHVSAVEAARMLAALDPADRPLWATAFYAGLRRGEMVGLRWEDVNLADGVIRVRRGWDEVEGEIAPKTNQGRRAVPIPGALRDYLLEHRVNGDGTGRVLPPHRQIRAHVERAADRWEAAGMGRLTLHEARHTYASLMIAAWVNAKALSTFMGHANIAITLDLYGISCPAPRRRPPGCLTPTSRAALAARLSRTSSEGRRRATKRAPTRSGR